LENAAVWNNLVGATFNIENDAPISTNFGGNTTLFNNFGTLVKRASNTSTIGTGFFNAGTIDVETGTLSLSGYFANYSRADKALVGGTYLVKGILRFSGANIMVNQADITLDGATSRILGDNSADALASFSRNDQQGAFTLQNNRSLSTSANFSNAGTFNLDSGSFFSAATYTQTDGVTNLSSSTLSTRNSAVMIQAGVLSGAGIINGAVTNAAELDPGGAGTTGILIINGDYTQTNTGILNIDLAGLSPGTEYDQLQVTGMATLDGTLNVHVLDGFFVHENDSFRVLTFASHMGNFATTTGLDLGGGLVLDPTFDASGLTLNARQLPVDSHTPGESDAEFFSQWEGALGA
jgi:hypothetical protein